MNKLLLELHVDDFDPIKDYYQQLGFEVVWERSPEGMKGYLVLQLEGNILCFWAGNKKVYNQKYFSQFPQDTPKGYGVEIVIQLADVRSFYAKYQDVLNVVEPLSMQPWGLEDFRAVDPAGFYLRFTSNHDILDPNNAVD